MQEVSVDSSTVQQLAMQAGQLFRKPTRPSPAAVSPASPMAAAAPWVPPSAAARVRSPAPPRSAGGGGPRWPARQGRHACRAASGARESLRLQAAAAPGTLPASCPARPRARAVNLALPRLLMLDVQVRCALRTRHAPHQLHVAGVTLEHQAGSPCLACMPPKGGGIMPGISPWGAAGNAAAAAACQILGTLAPSAACPRPPAQPSCKLKEGSDGLQGYSYNLCHEVNFERSHAGETALCGQ